MSKLIEEELEPGFRALYKIEKVLHSGQSQFQTVDIVDLAPFGRTLLIDGMIQSCQIDEFVYHECLVHPAMLLHATGVKTVYIGGGGECSTAREVLRHASVTKCTMVDIDAEVFNFCKAGLKLHTSVFTPINATLKTVFKQVVGYTQAVYSFCDEWGWNMAFATPREGGMAIPVAEVDALIKARITGELKFLDGESYQGLPALSKVHRANLAKETRVMSVATGTFSFMHSQGLCVAESK
ncbi:S-adenosyl-L-methionine-dependent methyltransferase [Pavlovales sp. CCMP2436]|nr:S-adenosyl-L-methionine-dependent methyltransferase [Pavlovales sp. CCMP2436]